MPFAGERTTMERGKSVKLMSQKYSTNKPAQNAVRHPDDIKAKIKQRDKWEAEEVGRWGTISIILGS